MVHAAAQKIQMWPEGTMVGEGLTREEALGNVPENKVDAEVEVSYFIDYAFFNQISENLF